MNTRVEDRLSIRGPVPTPLRLSAVEDSQLQRIERAGPALPALRVD